MRTGGRSWSLTQDWVIAPALDLEFKQYTLLAYVQRMEQRFAERKLFPYLADVAEHVARLLALQQEKTALAQAFTGNLLGFDQRTGEAIHERPADHGALAIVDEVVRFALPGLEKLHAQGRALHEEFAALLQLEPVGVQPLRRSEGWLLVRTGPLARAYAYTIPLVGQVNVTDPHRLMRTRFVTSFSMGLHRTYEGIKAELLERQAWLPNPAVFAAEFKEELPHMETALPLIKRSVHDRAVQA